MERKLFILILIPFLASGCLVSKKKYDAMTSQKELLARRLSREKTENKTLKAELKTATADFEAMKYELHKSDALKSDKVSSLMVDSEEFKDQLEELKKELANTRKLFQTQKANSQESASALRELNKKIRSLSSDTASLRYTLTMAKERQQAIHQELNNTKEKFRQASISATKLNNDMKKQKQKMALMEQQLVEKSQTLQNISESFIALRKSMLSAKSSNKPIDPNHNKLVDKIARLLGHY